MKIIYKFKYRLEKSNNVFYIHSLSLDLEVSTTRVCMCAHLEAGSHFVKKDVKAMGRVTV